jgi:hypothetical protein
MSGLERFTTTPSFSAFGDFVRVTDEVLRVDLHDVDVRADVEVSVHQLAVVGAVGLDIERFIRAVDFGFDRCRHQFHH